MKLLSKKFNMEKTVGTILLESVLSAIIISLLIYLYFNTISNTIQKIINNPNVPIFKFVLSLFPVILIVVLAVKFAEVNIFQKKKNTKN